MSLEEIAASLSAAEFKLAGIQGEVSALSAKGQQAQSSAVEARSVVEACEQAANILAKYADERQAEIIKSIEQIASQGLSQIFDEDIQLRITQVVRARRVEMDVRILTGDLETSVMDARGGGLAAITGFLLRACVLLLTPDARRTMLLDEVFAHLSAEYVPRAAEFLRELCEISGLQIILVTHQDEFIEAAHKVYRIQRTSKNSSTFVELKEKE